MRPIRARRISELPLLTETEQRQLLEEWNGIRAEYPIHKGLHQLFEEQVELDLDASPPSMLEAKSPLRC